MSDTPRTDAFHKQIFFGLDSAYKAVLEHARQLERELAKEKIGHEDAHRQCDRLHEYARRLEDQLYGPSRADTPKAQGK